MRGADEKRLEAIYQTVEQKPGIKPGKVAAQLDIPRSSVMRALPALEQHGLLLSEDAGGWYSSSTSV